MSKTNKWTSMTVVLTIFALSSCAAPKSATTPTVVDPAPTAESKTSEMSKDVRWVRQSVEYIALCNQLYRQAWDAVRKQAEKTEGPWAVVLDVDETVLDNSLYEVEIQALGKTFSSESWDAWVAREEAVPIAGVKKFLDQVRAYGENASVVFITNRDAHHTEATRRNLQKYGLWGDGDLLMCRNNREDSKIIRRAEVINGNGRAASFGPRKIIALFGDNYKDFTAVDAAIGMDALRKAAETDSLWGTKYFVLPNPMYGSWERGYK